MTQQLEHLRLGPAIKVAMTEAKPPDPTTLYEILDDFLNDDQNEPLFQIYRPPNIDAIACFVSTGFPEKQPVGFNFLLRPSDRIELLLDGSLPEPELDNDDTETETEPAEDATPDIIGCAIAQAIRDIKKGRKPYKGSRLERLVLLVEEALERGDYDKPLSLARLILKEVD